MLWLYFWLLLWEGVLRKWVLPGFSDVIFVIRDPVAFLAYLLAFRAGIFPWRPAVSVVIILAALSVVFSIANDNRFAVTLFGLRTDFLHLPLIFLMATVLDRDDVIRFGKWFLICSIPILFLMVRQFNAEPGDLINAGAGGSQYGQIRGALGKIRPAGPFSFVAGTVVYYNMVAAFVFYGWLQPGTYNRLLLFIATTATVFAVPISISRSLLLGVLIVIAFGLAVVLKDPKRIPNFLGPLIAAVGFLAFSADTIYVQAFAVRWDEASGTTSAELYQNTAQRMLADFFSPIDVATQVPFFGYGIGLGTVAGAHLATGQYAFLLAESELGRLILELGPILGFAFIFWRVWLTVKLVFGSWQHYWQTANPLAWLIAGACFLNVLNGQWGPATTLGFAVFGAGLTLAALNGPAPDTEAESGSAVGSPPEDDSAGAKQQA